MAALREWKVITNLKICMRQNKNICIHVYICIYTYINVYVLRINAYIEKYDANDLVY